MLPEPAPARKEEQEATSGRSAGPERDPCQAIALLRQGVPVATGLLAGSEHRSQAEEEAPRNGPTRPSWGFYHRWDDGGVPNAPPPWRVVLGVPHGGNHPPTWVRYPCPLSVPVGCVGAPGGPTDPQGTRGPRWTRTWGVQTPPVSPMGRTRIGRPRGPGGIKSLQGRSYSLCPPPCNFLIALLFLFLRGEHVPAAPRTCYDWDRNPLSPLFWIPGFGTRREEAP